MDTVRQKKIRLGLIIAGLVAAGTASLPTVLGPDASATQPPPFVTNPTATTKSTNPTKPAEPPAAGVTATSVPVPSSTVTASEAAKPGAGPCDDYTDNNWCPKG